MVEGHRRLVRVDEAPPPAAVVAAGRTGVAQGDAGPPGQQGPQGPAGDFTGHFASPNGLYAIDVADTGIVLSGPNTSVTVGAHTITLLGAGEYFSGSITELARPVLIERSSVV